MACIDYPLCKYAHYEDGALVCSTGAPCTFQRYCSTLLKVIHTSAYKTCKEAKSMDNKKKTRTKKEVFVENKNDEVVETKSNEIIEKKELCKVRYDGGFMYISFKGYGLALPNDKGHKENELYVYYSGEIGSPDFKFRI
jgi:hypothetical protein